MVDGHASGWIPRKGSDELHSAGTEPTISAVVACHLPPCITGTCTSARRVGRILDETRCVSYFARMSKLLLGEITEI